MGVTLVHDFHTQIGAVENVGPGVDDTSLRINDGLVEIEAIKVEGHGGDSHSRQPDSDHRPGSQEEVEGTGVVEGSVLEDETSEVSVRRDNVVSFLFLSELVSSVGRLGFGGLTDQGGCDQGSVHGREEGGTEDTGNSSHVHGIHQNVMFGLEDKHKVEGSTDSKRHTIGEGSLTDGVGEEDGSRSGNRGRESSEDPRTHTKAVTEFPFSAHVGGDSNQEVKNGELVLSSVVEPLVERSRFPDGVKMHSNGIGTGDDSARDDVISVDGGAMFVRV